MTTSYRQELEKYRDIDEDKLLKELSPEELDQLDLELQEMDPEVRSGAVGVGERTLGFILETLQIKRIGDGPGASSVVGFGSRQSCPKWHNCAISAFGENQKIETYLPYFFGV